MNGLRGLSYPKYQEDRLKQFLNKNTGMKILVHVDALSKDDDTITFKSRRYEVLNTDDITDVMTKMAIDIETQIGNAQLSKSNIIIKCIMCIIVIQSLVSSSAATVNNRVSLYLYINKVVWCYFISSIFFFFSLNIIKFGIKTLFNLHFFH